MVKGPERAPFAPGLPTRRRDVYVVIKRFVTRTVESIIRRAQCERTSDCDTGLYVLRND